VVNSDDADAFALWDRKSVASKLTWKSETMVCVVEDSKLVLMINDLLPQ